MCETGATRRPDRIRIMRSFMTYQPFLPEAAAGSLEPRHVVVPLRKELEGVDVVTGRVCRVLGYRVQGGGV